MNLYDYQDRIIQETRYRMKGKARSIVVVSPTGSGKTVLTAHMLRTSAAKRMRSLFIVHRRELIKQSIKAFEEEGVKFGVIANGFTPDPRPLVQIASIQTLVNRLEFLREPKLIVWDEAHHCRAKSWERVYNMYPGAYHIGLTATPMRLDGKGLGKYFQTMVVGPEISWLVENKFLSPFRYFAPPAIKVTGVGSRMGDYIRSELAEVCDRPSITGDAIKEYRDHGNGGRALIFCVSVLHSQHVCAAFQNAGFSTTHIDAKTPTAERDQAMVDFISGKLQIISSVDIYGEGVDVPALEVIIQMRPTQSLGLCRQQWGRALRVFPGKKEAIILDMAGNHDRHGLPDEVIDWTLEDRKQKPRENGIPTRTCPECYSVQKPGKPVCIYCGFTFEIKYREVEERKGDLVEIDEFERAKMRLNRNQEEARAETYQDLIELGKKRGYKPGWAWHRMRARQAKKMRGE